MITLAISVFGLGLVFGAAIGVGVMCLITAARQADE